MKSVLLTLPLFLAALYAQGQGFHRNATGGGTPPTPTQMAQNQTNHLTKFFNLTTQQQSTVLGILETSDTQIATLRTQIKPLHQTLVTAIKANNTTNVATTLQQISTLQLQVETLQATAAAQIYAQLNQQQQSQIPNGLGPLMGFGFGR
jgi:molybdopterin-biosynthesis enzyme MoeA-like protein